MTTEQFVIKLGLNSSGVTSGANSAEATIKRLATSAKLWLAGIGVGGALMNLTRQEIELGGAVTDGARKMDISTDTFQEWGYAAKQSGAEMSDLDAAFKKMQVSQVGAIKGNQEMAEAYQRIGFKIEDLKKLKPEDLFNKIALKTGKMAGSAQLTTDIGAILGKGSGMTMLSAFRDGFGDAAKEAKNLGQVIEASVIKELDDAGDAMDRLKGRWLANLAPMVTGAIRLGQQISDAVQLSILEIQTRWNVRRSGGTVAQQDQAVKNAQEEWLKNNDTGKGTGFEPKKGSTDASDVMAMANKNPFKAPAGDTLSRVGLYRGGTPSGELMRIPQLQYVEQQKTNVHLNEIKAASKATLEAHKTVNSMLSIIGVHAKWEGDDE